MWRTNGDYTGECHNIICERGIPVLFRKKREAKAWIDDSYGYIKSRPDLRAAPHRWRLPIPVKVTIAVNSI